MIKLSLILSSLIFVHFPFLYDGGNGSTLAFPGAEGAGKYATGGRGGKLFKVTNLNDSGKGSLRDVIEQKGARIIVFDLSGTIELKDELVIRNGDLTIAGQSAPGDGICIKGYPLILKADNIIIRFLRVRLGDLSGKPYDAISCTGNKNIIIDHCSFSWAVDECASFYDNKNFTLQWSIISESLNNSVHPKGEHGYGGIWGGMQASFHHNILAHHKSRLPRLQGSRYHHQPEMEQAEFCNNLVYNWKSQCAYGGEEGNYNIIKNIFIPGPSTIPGKYEKVLEPYEPYGKFYLKDNYILIEKEKKYSWKFFEPKSNKILENRLIEPVEIKSAAKIGDPKDEYDEILQYAGVSLNRDEVDKRIVDEIKNRNYHFGENGIIDSQNQVGGWPDLKSLPHPHDNDKDGMPDEWERVNNLNPVNGNDYNNFDLSTIYTNIEVYLNSLLHEKEQINL